MLQLILSSMRLGSRPVYPGTVRRGFRTRVAVFVATICFSSAAAATGSTASFEPVEEPASGAASFPVSVRPAASQPPPPPVVSQPPQRPVAPLMAPPRQLQPTPVQRQGYAPPLGQDGATMAGGNTPSRPPAEWMLSLEGVTHIPVDVGAQVVLETPGGFRLLAGYGFIPNAYIELVTPSEKDGQKVEQSLYESGTAYRFGIGLRPSPSMGLYFDGGLIRASLNGSVTEPVGLTGSAVGEYELSSKLSLWFVEAGYQGHLSERVVAGLGIGVMGTLDANSEVSGSPKSVGSNSQALTDEAAAEVDRELESYGIVPTVTLRFGFDAL